MKRQFYVYLLMNKTNTVIYTGVTSDLPKRAYEHKQGLIKGFTSRYNVNKLVYFEVFDSALGAIRREKCLKEWARAWKIRLIEKSNPEWRDLYVQD